MKQGLQLRFSQNLALTPQLQQSIRLLQLSTQELNQELEAILQANPLLEHDEKNADGSDAVDIFIPSSTAQEIPNPQEATRTEEVPVQENFADDYLEYGGSTRWDDSNAGNDEDNDYSFQEAATETLREHLVSQLKLLPLSSRDQMLALVLTDAINDDGYLEQPLEELVDMFEEDTEVDLLELQTALKHIQNLDPAGVGARNLSECLSLQLRALEEQTPLKNIAQTLVEHHLPLLAARDYAKLRKLLHCDDEMLPSSTQDLAMPTAASVLTITFSMKSSSRR
jgi:RNA polymerase sigma-54 factor